MAHTRKERIALARRFLDQYRDLERANCDAVGWLMLKFSCSRAMAEQLVDAIEQYDAQQRELDKTNRPRIDIEDALELVEKGEESL